MASYYFDTSALAKRYVVEIGSSWVQDVIAQQSGQSIYTSMLSQPEIVSALQRRVREGHLEADEALEIAQQVVAHMSQSYALIAIAPPVITQACTVLQRHPLRAYDALHLACAQAVREVLEGQQLAVPVFVAADITLLAAAAAEGFVVDKPLHPLMWSSTSLDELGKRHISKNILSFVRPISYHRSQDGRRHRASRCLTSDIGKSSGESRAGIGHAIVCMGEHSSATVNLPDDRR